MRPPESFDRAAIVRNLPWHRECWRTHNGVRCLDCRYSNCLRRTGLPAACAPNMVERAQRANRGKARSSALSPDVRHCSKSIQQVPAGRPRRFCSTVCKPPFHRALSV